jgi:hypothetical protein
MGLLQAPEMGRGQTEHGFPKGNDIGHHLFLLSFKNLKAIAQKIAPLSPPLPSGERNEVRGKLQRSTLTPTLSRQREREILNFHPSWVSPGSYKKHFSRIFAKPSTSGPVVINNGAF